MSLEPIRPPRWALALVAGVCLALALWLVWGMSHLEGAEAAPVRSGCEEVDPGCYLGVPSTVNAAEFAAGSYGVKFSTTVAYQVTGVKWYQWATGANAVRWALYDVTAASTVWSWTDGGSFSGTAGSWRELDLQTGGRSPVDLVAGHSYIVTYQLSTSAGVWVDTAGSASPPAGVAVTGSCASASQTDSPGCSPDAHLYLVDVRLYLPAPTATPTSTPTAAPTSTPTPGPTNTPTPGPTNTPTPAPTSDPGSCGTDADWSGGDPGPIFDVWDGEYQSISTWGELKRVVGTGVTVCAVIPEGHPEYSVNVTGDVSGTYLVAYSGTHTWHVVQLDAFLALGAGQVGRMTVPGTPTALGVIYYKRAARVLGYQDQTHECMVETPGDEAYIPGYWVCDNLATPTPAPTNTPGPTNTPAPSTATAIPATATQQFDCRGSQPSPCWVRVPGVETPLAGVATGVSQLTGVIATAVGIPASGYAEGRATAVWGSLYGKGAAMGEAKDTLAGVVGALVEYNADECASFPGIPFTMSWGGTTTTWTFFAVGPLLAWWCAWGRHLVGVVIDIAVVFYVWYSGRRLLGELR